MQAQFAARRSSCFLLPALARPSNHPILRTAAAYHHHPTMHHPPTHPTHTEPGPSPTPTTMSTTDNTNGATAAAEPPTAAAAGAATGYEDEETLHKLADVLRTTMKIRNGVLQETRVDYFKGALFGVAWRAWLG